MSSCSSFSFISSNSYARLMDFVDDIDLVDCSDGAGD